MRRAKEEAKATSYLWDTIVFIFRRPEGTLDSDRGLRGHIWVRARDLTLVVGGGQPRGCGSSTRAEPVQEARPPEGMATW